MIKVAKAGNKAWIECDGHYGHGFVFLGVENMGVAACTMPIHQVHAQLSTCKGGEQGQNGLKLAGLPGTSKATCQRAHHEPHVP